MYWFSTRHPPKKNHRGKNILYGRFKLVQMLKKQFTNCTSKVFLWFRVIVPLLSYSSTRWQPTADPADIESSGFEPLHRVNFWLDKLTEVEGHNNFCPGSEHRLKCLHPIFVITNIIVSLCSVIFQSFRFVRYSVNVMNAVYAARFSLSCAGRIEQLPIITVTHQ